MLRAINHGWLAASLLAGLFACGYGQAALAALSDAQCVSIIEKAKILTPDSRVQASVGPREVWVSAYRNPKANEKDCKIDAILMAKVLMDADPKNITMIKVRFYDPTNRTSFREVRVGAGVVKAFGEGRVSQDELLASVALDRGEEEISKYRNQSYREITGSSEVVDGVYRSERLGLYSRIQALKERGVGVQPFMGEFFRIEDQVRRGDDGGARAAMHYLDSKLSEQEERYKQAQAHRQHPGMGGQAPGGQAYTNHPFLPQPGMHHGPGPQPGMMEAMKNELGADAPVFGPLVDRRYRLIRRIRDLQAQGKIVDTYRSTYREIESLAQSGSMDFLRMKVKVLEHQLGMPSMDF